MEGYLAQDPSVSRLERRLPPPHLRQSENGEDLLRVDLFDFELPPERIALRPARPRDAARMLVVRPDELSDAGVADLPGLLRRGDVLVFNDTRVIPAQLEGRRGDARIGATLHKRIDLRRWQAFVRNGRRWRRRSGPIRRASHGFRCRRP